MTSRYAGLAAVVLFLPLLVPSAPVLPLVGIPPAAAQDVGPNLQQRPNQRPRIEREPPEGTEVVAAIWCDTPDQLETVLRAHYDRKVPLASAIATINENNPEACVPARAIIKIGAEVRRFNAEVAIFAVHSATVVGIMRGPYALMMQPQTWYHAKVIAELTPL